MVCDGPDPPENNSDDLIPPPRHEFLINGDDSDEERHEGFGYQPLPQGPDATQSDHDSSDDEIDNINTTAAVNDVPPIETMDALLTREVWNAPRSSQSIEMDNERAEQVMSAMANFALPQTSIPEWAQSITDEQWKQTLKDRLEKLKDNR
ncbi:unnamed protein product [Diatraea saccharalis]|uniref:Male-enhanced antigen 1 n=1 Tax=Diatraea saccharalis TaxID=40085 RepID=A0A9N9QXS0_9NEOP|nr:unnamed protein product [Diatraea saccharalis]